MILKEFKNFGYPSFSIMNDKIKNKFSILRMFFFINNKRNNDLSFLEEIDKLEIISMTMLLELS